MRPHLPLNSLRAFEAASRHMNFVDAAAELGVTPAAVSQHIRKLEDLIGAQLFDRTTRSVALTEKAKSVYPVVSEGFGRLDSAMRELLADRQQNVVTISTTASFASCWLLPRLDRFQGRNRDVTVHVDARNEHVDFVRDNVDLSIRQGTGKYAGLSAELLVEDRALVVCNPRFFESSGTPQSPDQLVGHQLLHVDWKIQSQAAPTWQKWFEYHGLEGSSADGGTHFSMEEHAVKAAVAGMGLALATLAFVSNDISSGSLTRALPEGFDMSTEFNHYLVYPKSSLQKNAVRKFIFWLKEEADAFLPGAEQ